MGAHHAFRHRQPQRPGLVAGSQIFVPAEGDDAVLGARLGFSRKGQWLVRHHTQFDSDGSGHHSRRGQERVYRGQCRLGVRTAGDGQQRRISCNLVRHREGQLVPPARTVDLGAVAPALGHELEQVCGVAVAREYRDRLPAIARIGQCHIAIERGPIDNGV